MNTFDTIIDMGVMGEQEVEVHYGYEAAEQASRYEPGCSESVDIDKVMWKGMDIMTMLPEEELEIIVSQILEEIHYDYSADYY